MSCWLGLDYFPSSRWSSNILLVTMHKLPNIISKHCLVDLPRIYDDKISELKTSSLEISVFSKNIVTQHEFRYIKR